MSDTKPEHAAEGTTATKAIVGSAIAIAVTFLGALSVAIADNVVTGQEWVTIASATLIAAGGVFGGVYATTNTPK
jgi:hypothetical protein